MLLRIVDREGNQHEMNASPSDSLMEALRSLEYGVLAICGGSCACATCHVYITSDWLEQLPPPQSDELELIASLDHRRETSRLSCQIRLSDALDGLRVTLAPDE